MSTNQDSEGSPSQVPEGSSKLCTEEIEPEAQKNGAGVDSEASRVEPQQVEAKVPAQASNNDEVTEGAVSSQADLNLKWDVIGTSPYEVQRYYSDAVVKGSVVYIDEIRLGVIAYDFEKGTWSEPFSSPPNHGTLVVVNNMLTAVGGMSDSKLQNKLYSRVGEGDSEKWSEEFPPMPTARCDASAVCAKGYLIVAGGRESKKVELMNTETLQWSAAPSLPAKLSGYSMTVCGESIYMLGGREYFFLEGEQDTKFVYSCSLSALFEERSLGSKIASALSLSKTWKKVADLPVAMSACVAANNRLLAVGGMSANAATVCVRMYDPTNNRWKIVSHMKQPRHSCYPAVLPDNTILVIGGRGPQYCIGYIQEVEKATIE